MYESFFGLREKPFSIQPDPDYMFWSKGHALAFAMIEYGIMNRAGFTVITGEIGSGKTTLIRHLLNRLGDEVTVGLVSNAVEKRGELLHWVLMAFGKPYEEKPVVALHADFYDFLISEYAEGRRTILIVDEAQNLGPQTLEELRMLSNINADKDQLLQVILVGQPQLKTLLQDPDLVQFAQRIASDYHLRPLNAEETVDYIQHRLDRAGARVEVFTRSACLRISRAARGIPRLINVLCDTALVYGFSTGTRLIDVDLIEEIIKDKSENGIFQYDDPPRAETGKDDDRKSVKPALAQDGPVYWRKHKVISIE